MELQQRKFPVGIQTFSEIIDNNLVYVDKTDLVWKLAHQAKFIFLSRPRRFGKSLLTTTLKSYFLGHKHLFEGLKIMELEKEWKTYPVIHIDLSVAKGQESTAALQDRLMLLLKQFNTDFTFDDDEKTPGGRLQGMINRASKQGKVVIIIDEYDAPLLEVMHEQENLKGMRRVMQEFYQPLKASEGMIRFCFITGITRFSQLSIFSTINNIADVSLVPDYATICGITELELTTTLRQDIEMLAKEYECSYDERHAKLKRRYDGYHFSEDSEEVYNPYSLVKCFTFKKMKNYWFDSGTSQFLLQQMKRFGTDISKMDEFSAPEASFYCPTETMTDALPLLYQSGYLTIKDYDRELENYSLKIPNTEVRVGFTEDLLPFVSGIQSSSVQIGCAAKIWKALKTSDVDLAMRELKAFLAGIPYVEGFKKKLEDPAVKEDFYEYTFYLILSMLNVYVQTQVKCWGGRIDMTVFTADTIYIFEFKVTKNRPRKDPQSQSKRSAAAKKKSRETALAALQQIKDNGYANQYATDPRHVALIGVSFDINNWTIDDWEIEKGLS